MKILIKHGRVIDPETGTDEFLDVLVSEDRITKLDFSIEEEADMVIDARGCFVMPGLIDLHVHLREPGFEYKETIETGARAAARGGFTTICAMPNTNPAIDTAERINWTISKAKREAIVNVLPIGAITVGQNGEELTDIKAMKQAGACAVSEDGKSVMDVGLYKLAMESAKENQLPVFAHCEDKNLAGSGVINKGSKSKEFSVEGLSNEVENVIIERDIRLAKETGVHLHLCHCSTAESVSLIRRAKTDGVRLTAEVCPHHFTLTQEDMAVPDANFKMNPPLRTMEDREALIEGLRNDIIDVIATDHAPHQLEEKDRPLDSAPFGIVGLETAVPLTVTELLHKGVLTPMQMAEKLSTVPAKILGLDRGSLKIGKVADITIINPDEEYIIDTEYFASKSKNTPFHGRTVKGRVKVTMVNGEVVFKG